MAGEAADPLSKESLWLVICAWCPHEKVKECVPRILTFPPPLKAGEQLNTRGRQDSQTWHVVFDTMSHK